jgi:hypothetical protein
MTEEHREVVLRTLRDAQRFHVNRVLFHEAHASRLASFTERGGGTDVDSETFAANLEHHLDKVEWHREQARLLSEATKQLEVR